jgi:hypothetical protein
VEVAGDTRGEIPVIYVYQNQNGERREIVASMKNPPPERVMFRTADEWEPAPDDCDVPAWTRVYGECQINPQKWASKAYGVGRYDIPKNLPGCDVDAKGLSIVRDKHHERAIMKEHGFVKYED